MLRRTGKARIFAVSFLVGLALWMVLIWGVACHQTRQAASDTDKPPGPATAPAETTVETPPTGWEAFATNSDKNASNIGKVTVTPILAYLGLIGTGLGIYVLYRLIPQFVRPPELVIETFRNSSGDEALGGVVGGLNRLARQKLIPQMKILQAAREERTRAKADRETWANAYKYSYPRETPDQSLNELTSSLKDLAPDQFKSFLGFIGAAFPRRGIRVVSDLQRQNNMPGKLGISFELEDMRNQQDRDLCTIWEPTTQGTTAGDLQQPAAASPGQSLPSRKEQRRASKVDTKTEPSAEEKEAKALCKLGALYEEDGDLQQAKSRYEDALKKQPTSVEAHEALKRVLQKERTLVERYNVLLDPAVRWLALQIDRRGWLAKKFTFGGDQEGYLADVHNYFGVLYQTSGPTYGSIFYHLAVEDFESAMKHRRNWYKPYMQLAVTYSFMGREEQTHKRDVLQRKALREYDRALRRVRPEEQKVADAVKVGRAIVQLLSRNDDLKAQAVREIERIEKSENVIEKLLRTTDKDVSLLYNLACWYSMAYGQKVEIADAKEISLRYLTYSLARDHKRKLWDWADNDPDLKPIRDSIPGGLTSLKDELSMLPESEDGHYEEALRGVPRKVAGTIGSC